MERMKRSTAEKVLLGLSLMGGASIFPFSIIRLLSHQWLIGVVDFIISAGMFSLFIYVFVTGNSKKASHILSVIALLGMIATIYLKGAHQIYWAYPATVVVYFLLKPKIGLSFTLLSILALVPLVYKEAHSINGIAIVVTLLMTNTFAYIFASEMNKQRKKLLKQATIDPLTKTGNRRALKQKMKSVIAGFHRSGIPVSLLLLDLDHFKNINDSYGHNEGDRFLTKISQLIKSRIRSTDSLYRFGGEEFIVIAENTTATAARVLAEELRTTVEKTAIIPDCSTTISIGVAELAANATDEQWIKSADDALFEAKQSGRNKTCIHIPSKIQNIKLQNA